MAKADSKQKNVRLRNDVWFAVEELQERWGVSRDMVLEKAITAAHAAFCGVTAAVDTVTTNSSFTPIGLDEIPGVQVGMGLPKNATCAHCGKKFVGARFASLCGDCIEAGHLGDVRECKACGERDGAL